MLFGQQPNSLKDLREEATELAGLKFEEYKLKGLRTLTTALSGFLGYILLFIVLSVVLILGSQTLVQWLNGILGEPWGTLIVFGFFLVIFLLLWIFRAKLFTALAAAIIPGADKFDVAVSDAEAAADRKKTALVTDYEKYKSTRLSTRIFSFISNHPEIVEAIVPALLSLIGLARKRKRKK